MQTNIAFDTLAYAKKMKSVGFTEQQAEMQAETFLDIVEGRLATKQDILGLKQDIIGLKRDTKELEVTLKRDIKELEVGLRQDMLGLKRDTKELEVTLKRDIKELELALKCDMKNLETRLKHDLTIRLGGMLVASIAVVAALIKLL